MTWALSFMDFLIPLGPKGTKIVFEASNDLVDRLSSIKISFIYFLDKSSFI